MLEDLLVYLSVALILIFGVFSSKLTTWARAKLDVKSGAEAYSLAFCASLLAAIAQVLLTSPLDAPQSIPEFLQIVITLAPQIFTVQQTWFQTQKHKGEHSAPQIE